MRMSVLATAALLVLGLSGEAYGVERSGFTLSLTAGGAFTTPTGGLKEQTDSLPGGFGVFNIGGFVTDSLSLMFDAQMIISGREKRTLITGVLGVASDFFVSDRLSLRGGVGFSHIGFYRDFDPGQISALFDGLRLTAGLAYDVVQSESFGLALVYLFGADLLGAAEGVEPPPGQEKPEIDATTLISNSLGLSLRWY